MHVLTHSAVSMCMHTACYYVDCYSTCFQYLNSIFWTLAHINANKSQQFLLTAAWNLCHSTIYLDFLNVFVYLVLYWWISGLLNFFNWKQFYIADIHNHAYVFTFCMWLPYVFSLHHHVFLHVTWMHLLGICWVGA